MSEYKIMLAAGGTGGHVYPAIAIADAIMDSGNSVKVTFVGTRDRMEWTAVPKSGYDIQPIWISGFHRRLTLKNLLFPVKLVVSLLQCYVLVKRYKPDVVVSCGGFASGPLGWVAGKLNIPLILQEQNSYPGVTTRKLASKAVKIFIAFENARKFFPQEKTELCGNPIRKQIKSGNREEALSGYGLPVEAKTLLILGGSGGARMINNAVYENLKGLHDILGLNIIWQCGNAYFDSLKTKINFDAFKNLRLVSFLDDMPKAYAAADLVISRAGALSCSELMLTGKPSILIPSPVVAGDHQTKNAASMVEKGAARLLKDNEAIKLLYDSIKDVINEPKVLNEMSKSAMSLATPDAANIIAQRIIEIIDQNRAERK